MRNDIRFALRLLLRSKTFSLGVIAALALGIGANSAIFTVVQAVLIDALPFREPDRLVWVTSALPGSDNEPFSLPEFLDYQATTTSMTDLAAIGTSSMSLVGIGDAERVQGMSVSAHLFAMLGAEPSVGRALSLDDDRPGAEPVVVLSDPFWRRRFGGDSAIVGRAITLNGRGYRVVGVMPPSFALPPREADVLVPLSPGKHPWRDVRGSVNFLRVVGRMKPGVSIAQAAAELSTITQRLKQTFPVDYAQRRGVRLTALRDQIVKNHRQNLWTLLGAVGFVLLIACANVASLFLARASTRHREFAIRTALGASRSRVTRQLLIEIGLIAGVSGVVGSAVAIGGVRAFVALGPSYLPRLGEIHADFRVLGFTALITLIAALAFGLVPALRPPGADRVESLREGRGSPSDARTRTRSLLIIVEMMLAVTLLAGTGLLLRSLREIQRIEPGFDASGVLTARLALAPGSYPDLERVTALYENLGAQLRALPGVRSNGVTSILPMSGPLATVNFTIDGLPMARQEAPTAYYRMVSPDYLPTIAVPLQRGRNFDLTDRPDGRPVAIVNRRFAETFFPNGDAIGKSVRVDDNSKAPRPLEIVGVVGDVKHDNLEGKPTFDVYVPTLQVNSDALVWLRNNQFWVVRTDGDPARLAEPFRRALRAIDPNVPAARVAPFEDYLDSSLRQRRFNVRLLAAFAIVAVTLVGSGLYALIAYWVGERRQEIAIRLALGAAPSRILRDVVGRGLGLATVGLAGGLIASGLLTRMLEAQLFHVGRGDIATMAEVALLLASIAVLASLVPAMRATRVNPADVMRA